MTSAKNNSVLQSVKSTLQKFGIEEDDLLEISSKLKFLNLKKGEKFCQTGKVCDKVGILLEGLLFASFDTDKEKLNVSRFFYAPDNIIVTSFESFKLNRPSIESIEAIEESSILYISSKDLEELYSAIPAINIIGRHFAEESYIQALRRIHDMQTKGNYERIMSLFEKQSHLFNRASKNHLSSYLKVNRNDITKALKNARNAK